ncbi:LysR family transcriptional regulator [Vreelandella rituensis]|uniref:LysR family transcriptional regulator n=1 Tax=Vreelandella rituensis TaxID=2282306 RepID=A0A368U8E3_9GAMM|nr:LysR family transcriptional regulator [Halomonas rituensis]RCV93235.1 LysR family transcriptional regulator [Halomonas rituensis]
MHDLDELVAFAAVMESGSLTHSARALGLAKSTLSRRISQLEARLGQPLLRRQANRLLPTEAGHLFHSYCHQILELAEQSQTALETLRQDVSGDLKISVHSALAPAWLIPQAYKFMDRYPGVNLLLHPCETPPQSPAIHSITLWLGELPDTGLHHETLGWLTRGLYAHPDYLSRHGRPRHPRDLTHHAWIDLLGDTASGVVLQHAEHGHFHFLPPASRLKVNQDTLHNDAIARGRGLGIIPDWLAGQRETAYPGCLQRCLPGWSARALPVSLLYAYGHQPRKISAFLSLLRDAIPLAWQNTGPISEKSKATQVAASSTAQPTSLVQTSIASGIAHCSQ